MCVKLSHHIYIALAVSTLIKTYKTSAVYAMPFISRGIYKYKIQVSKAGAFDLFPFYSFHEKIDWSLELPHGGILMIPLPLVKKWVSAG